jgi:hydroxypyruvate isomerase
MLRRSFFSKLTGAGAAAAGVLSSCTNQGAPEASQEDRSGPIKRTGRLKQAICGGVFRGSDLDMEGMCREASRLGVQGFDLKGPEDFEVIKKYGMVPTMVGGGSGIKAGINNKSLHNEIEARMRPLIQATADAGAPNVIVMAGDREGISDEEGMENSVIYLNKVKGMAEDLGVNLCIELLNSKVNHPGYMADHTAWGVDVCKQVNSPRVGLLYDIYHMQIMEGDVIRTIRDNIKYILHFHTAGNPGRHQFDNTQELNYVGIATAIADLGYQGYLAHEYTPTEDPIGTLDKMLTICDV